MKRFARRLVAGAEGPGRWTRDGLNTRPPDGERQNPNFEETYT
jgi:hypothetical protein